MHLGKLTHFMLLLCLALHLQSQEIPLRPELDGWGGLKWGEGIEDAKEIYDFSAQREIHSTNDREIVMSRTQDMQITGLLFGCQAEILFHFDMQDRLKAVEARFEASAIPDLKKITEELESLYGSYGEKKILSLNTGEMVGTARIWLRNEGVLQMQHSTSYCSLFWEKPWSAEFPTALFLAVDRQDDTEARYLIDGGHNLAVSYPIFEDESGELAEAGILDYLLMFYLQDPENYHYKAILQALIPLEPPLYFFPRQILEQLH